MPSAPENREYHPFGFILALPSFTEVFSSNPIPYYSVNFCCADYTIENLWLTSEEMLLFSNEAEVLA